MSEFLAEASVLIRPDTSKFRAELQAQLATATRGLVVPVAISAGAAQQVRQQLSNVVATQIEGAEATDRTVAALRREQEAQRVAGAAAAAHARQLGQLQRGAAATSLSFLGIRG